MVKRCLAFLLLVLPFLFIMILERHWIGSLR
jgi:hypothetical protein